MHCENYNITLNTGAKMPMLGLGVYKADDHKEVEEAIGYAAEAGYRLIDTASVYKNEAGVGRGIRSCGVPREDLFITTKVWNTAQRMGDIEGAFERSLKRLDLDYVDLYLIHWPVKGCYTDTWKELEKLYHSGRAKAIGVSNFNIHQLEDLFQASDITPAVNQIEYHPYFFNSELVDYCQANGIAVQAYAPLGRGIYMDNPIILDIAEKYRKTPAQVGLRWSIERKVAVIPKSVNNRRIIENSNIFNFNLTSEELKLIDQEHRNIRTSNPPDDISLADL